MVSLQVRLFSRAVGRGWRCRQMPLARVGSTRSVPATLGLPPLTARVLSRLHCSGSRLLYMERALPCVWFQFSGSPQKCRLGWACVLCLPRRSSSGSQEPDEHTLPGCREPSPLRGPRLSFPAAVWCALCLFQGAGLQPRPSRWMSTIQKLRKSLVRNWEPVCSLVGEPSLGPHLPLSLPPCLLPLAGMGQSAARQLFSGIAQSFLCSVNGPAVSSVSGFCRLIFFLSLALPQFKLLSHKSSLRLPSGHLGLVLTLSNATAPLCSAPTCCQRLGYFFAGSCFQACNLRVLFNFPPSQVALRGSKPPPDPPV